MAERQLPVGVIHICCMAPGPVISAMINVVFDFITTLGLTFQPWPSSLAASLPVPVMAMPPLPFSPVKFSGLMERLLASDTWYKLLKLLFKPVFFWAMATVAAHINVAVNKFFLYRIMIIS